MADILSSFIRGFRCGVWLFIVLLVRYKNRKQLNIDFIAGRLMADILSSFIRGFRCGVRYLLLFLLYINIKIGKNRC